MKFGIWCYEDQCWGLDNHGYVLWSEDCTLMAAQAVAWNGRWPAQVYTVELIHNNGLPARVAAIKEKEA